MDFEVESALNRSRRSILELVEQMPAAGTGPAILAVEKLGSSERRVLAKAGVSWIERRTGFVHISAPPYFIHDSGDGLEEKLAREGRAQRPRSARPTRLVGLSGRCVETLLLWLEATRQNATRDPLHPNLLAEMADVSLPLATKVLHRLEKDRVVKGVRRGKRTYEWTVTDPDRLLDLWIDEDVKPLRSTPVYVWARSSRDLLNRLIRLREVASHWAVGGVTAANLYTPMLTAEPKPAVWIPDDLPVQVALRALEGQEASEGSNLTLLQAQNDPWALHRNGPPDENFHDPTASDDVAHPQPVGEPKSRALLRWVQAPPPPAVHIAGLSIISRPRAVVEALREGRGRSEEVANALRRSLSLETLASHENPIDEFGAE